MSYLKVNKEALLKLDKHITDEKNEYSAKLKEIQAKAAEKKIDLERNKVAELELKEVSNLVRLPLWPEATRGVPNSILRGSLFAAIQSKDATLCRRKLLNDNDRFSLVYTGERLTQSDLDVWETILHLAKDQNLGNKIYYTETSFLKKMGRSTGGQNKQWLKGVLSKLNATAVEISFKDKKTYSFEGSLLSQVYRETDTGRFVLVLEPKLHRVFEEGNTWISWEERQTIGKRKPLAQWLHGYISSHAMWYPHKVETIREYSGSQTKQLKKFKQSLNNALEHLLSLNLIEDYIIDDKNHVHVKKTGSKAQQKYLADKEDRKR